jgi:hypothetical protein
MSTGELAAVVFNRGDEPGRVRCDNDTFAPLRAVDGLAVPSVDPITVTVPGQDAQLLRLTSR